MCQLVFFEHLSLDQGFEGVNLPVSLPRHKSDFPKGTFADDLERTEILRLLAVTKVAEIADFSFCCVVGFLLFLLCTEGRVAHVLSQTFSPGTLRQSIAMLVQMIRDRPLVSITGTSNILLEECFNK